MESSALILEFLLFILVGFILVKVFAKTYTIASGWQHYFPGFQFSSKDFYLAVQRRIYKAELPAITITDKSFLEKNIFSSKRTYLSVSVGEYVFYVCAAPFGNGTFVSWRLCITNEQLINRIPIVSKLLGIDRQHKSFYQIDTEAMYKSAIHNSILEVIGEINAEKGQRSLSELESQYK